MLMKVVIVCNFIVQVWSALFPTKPIDFRLTRSHLCKSENEIPVYIEQKRLTRAITVYNGNVTLPYPHKDIEFEVQLERWADGGWKKNAGGFKHNDPIKWLETFVGEIWFTLKDALGIPRKEFPIKPGFYQFANYSVDFGMLNNMPIKPFTFVGRLKIIYKFYKSGKCVQCLISEAEIAERIN